MLWQFAIWWMRRHLPSCRETIPTAKLVGTGTDPDELCYLDGVVCIAVIVKYKTQSSLRLPKEQSDNF